MYAIIENGIVTNIVVSNHQVASNWVSIPTGYPIAIGDSYDGYAFYSPEGEMRVSHELNAANQRIATLEQQNAELAEQNEMLTSCVLEMSEIVYA